ncbi:hypothetical protein GE061_010977, partial [Apolygus lucorum]
SSSASQFLFLIESWVRRRLKMMDAFARFVGYPGLQPKRMSSSFSPNVTSETGRKECR